MYTELKGTSLRYTMRLRTMHQLLGRNTHIGHHIILPLCSIHHWVSLPPCNLPQIPSFRLLPGLASVASCLVPSHCLQGSFASFSGCLPAWQPPPHQRTRAEPRLCSILADLLTYTCTLTDLALGRNEVGMIKTVARQL